MRIRAVVDVLLNFDAVEGPPDGVVRCRLSSMMPIHDQDPHILVKGIEGSPRASLLQTAPRIGSVTVQGHLSGLHLTLTQAGELTIATYTNGFDAATCELQLPGVHMLSAATDCRLLFTSDNLFRDRAKICQFDESTLRLVPSEWRNSLTLLGATIEAKVAVQVAFGTPDESALSDLLLGKIMAWANEIGEGTAYPRVSWGRCCAQLANESQVPVASSSGKANANNGVNTVITFSDNKAKRSEFGNAPNAAQVHMLVFCFENDPFVVFVSGRSGDALWAPLA